jgi:lipoprotein signal peptidase
LNPIKYGNGVYTYKVAVYGNVFDRYLHGKIADAYLNHIGATHWEILNNFS